MNNFSNIESRFHRGLRFAEVTYYPENYICSVTGIVMNDVGKSILRILDINDLCIHNRQVHRIQNQDSGESVPISVVHYNTNGCIRDNTDSISDTLLTRRKTNLGRIRKIDYRHLHSNSKCDNCFDFEFEIQYIR